jgi:hypothetical protein
MNLQELFDYFWKDYAALTPDALAINAMLEERGEKFFNDHVAFRTFNLDPIGLDSLAATFTALGYQQTGEYRFEEKKLRARSYSHPDPHAPHVFISELLTGEFSEELQEVVRALVGQIPADRAGTEALFTAHPTWEPIEYAAYQRLLAESEYAGWLAAFGIRANHFTVSINTLKTFDSIGEFNGWLLDAGFRLNESGGLVKGTPAELLEQSSTMANRIEWEFAGGERRTIPSCYYEFARRYSDPATGQLYEGFIAKSADKIFESTDSGRGM